MIGRLGKVPISVVVAACAFAWTAYSQDAPPSLGDVARQSRLQKQQRDVQLEKDKAAKEAASSKDATAGDAASKDAPPKTPRVYTNDEIPEHVGPAVPQVRNYQAQYNPQYYYEGNSQTAVADQWKRQFQAMKSSIASMQQQINAASETVHYASNCVTNCVQANAREKQKQDQIDIMKQQLEQLQKQLELMQEAARKQGFGSAVYDP